LGTTIDLTSAVIGVGPGSTVGEDIHAVIKSNRGHNLGKVIVGKNKNAESNTGIPGNIKDYI
jgi:xanthine dehydrogenase accessory factor